MTDPGKVNKMYKNHKILNNIINLTKTNSLNWSNVYKTSNLTIFNTKYIITDKKYILIEFIYDRIKNDFTSIIFNFINNNNNIKTEIIEIYPNNNKSLFYKYKLSNRLKKLFNYIK